MEIGVWIPSTHINAGWTFRPTCNPSAPKAETGEPQSRLASRTGHTGQLQAQPRDAASKNKVLINQRRLLMSASGLHIQHIHLYTHVYQTHQRPMPKSSLPKHRGIIASLDTLSGLVGGRGSLGTGPCQWLIFDPFSALVQQEMKILPPLTHSHHHDALPKCIEWIKIPEIVNQHK